MRTCLVTGGAGFIGSNFVRYTLSYHDDVRVVNLDALTYAANPASLDSVRDDPRYEFVHGNICDRALVRRVVDEYRPDYVVNFAAESHVDRSIENPAAFVETNVLGTISLLDAVRDAWVSPRAGTAPTRRYLQVSTDEVYGSLSLDDPREKFRPDSPLAPRSPYSASKASSDQFANAYAETYGLPVNVSRCSNNYGPCQHVEKFIPRQVTNLLNGGRGKLFGDGLNVRDWIHVEDHCSAIWAILTRGTPGRTYLVGADCERSNREVLAAILQAIGREPDDFDYVRDRPGHDRRYALDASATRAELGWEPAHRDFLAGLRETIAWYESNRSWWEGEKGETEAWYEAVDAAGRRPAHARG